MASVSILFVVALAALVWVCSAFEGVNFAGEMCECRVKLSMLINQKCDSCVNVTYLEEFKNRHGHPADEYCCNNKISSVDGKQDCFNNSMFPYQFCCDRKLKAVFQKCKMEYNAYPDQVCPKNDDNRSCVDGAALWLWYKIHRGYVPGGQYCCERPRDLDCQKGIKFGQEFCCTTIGQPCCDEIDGCCK